MFYPAKTFSVESVTSGHPDKVCDQISDAVLDECLRQDPLTRAGVEVLGSHGTLMLGGEITSKADVDYKAVAQKIYRDIGYEQELTIVQKISLQSPDIARGVDIGGAGDQGIMYGYAVGATKSFLPPALELVHALTRGLKTLRQSGQLTWLKPDGKAEVVVLDGQISTVLISCQHAAEIKQPEIKQALIKSLISPLLGDISKVKLLVNPTGQFIQGGFEADAGLTGRKIMVDTYGGLIPHGGGCFSGKDPSKVDRSAAYMCRFVAKNLVAAGLAKQCLVSVAYAIGLVEPLMIEAVDENGKSLAELVKQKFDFRPQAIIERLNLRQPIYLATAADGHFGNPYYPWEKLEKV